MKREITVTSIGVVRCSRQQIEDDNWDDESSSIELDLTQFTPDALLGLSEFSHLEIIFFMDQVEPAKIERSVRHPRNNPAWPRVGIFAQRGKNRPNQIGATICKLIQVEGGILHLKGLDAIDGTPVLDIKPWVKEFSPRSDVFQPTWMTELMINYWGPPRKN